MKKIFIITLIFLLIINTFIISSYSASDGTLHVVSLNGVKKDFPSFSNLITSEYPIAIVYKATKTGLDTLLMANYGHDSFNNNDVPFLRIYPEGSSNHNCLVTSYKAKRYVLNNNKWVYDYTYDDYYSVDIDDLYYLNCKLENKGGSGSLKYYDESYFLPHYPSFITTSEELASGKFTDLIISSGELNTDEDKFYFSIFGYSDGYGAIPTRILKTFELSSSSDYAYVHDLQIDYIIPQSELGIDFSNGNKYYFILYKDEETVFEHIAFQVTGLTVEEEQKNKQDLTNDKLDEQTDAIKEQTDAIKEQNETNKGIWDTLKDVLSYINPFSENFFVYKLIELLIEGLKSLFIPSDDFFSNYFTDLKNWFSDRLGFLFYPFEIIIEILSRILSINFSEPIFQIPTLTEPFTGSKILDATSYNLNSLLEQPIFNTIHEFYLIVVDAFIIFGLINLFKKKYEEVTNK